MVFFGDNYICSSSYSKRKSNKNSNDDSVNNEWNIIDDRIISESDTKQDEELEDMEELIGFKTFLKKHDFSKKLSNLLDFQSQIKNKIILDDIDKLINTKTINHKNVSVNLYAMQRKIEKSKETCYTPLCEGGMDCKHKLTYTTGERIYEGNKVIYNERENFYDCPKCLIVKSFKCNCDDCKQTTTGNWSIDCFSFYQSRFNLDKEKWTKFISSFYNYYYQSLIRETKVNKYTEYIDQKKQEKEDKDKEQIKEFEENIISFYHEMKELKKLKSEDERKYNRDLERLKRIYQGNEYILDKIEFQINN